jgi:hypothetical protein
MYIQVPLNGSGQGVLAYEGCECHLIVIDTRTTGTTN